MEVLARFNEYSLTIDPRAWMATVMAGYELEHAYILTVTSHPLGALKYRLPWFFGSVPSISIEQCWNKASVKRCGYAEINHFLDCWTIIDAKTRYIRVPFLRRQLGAGDAFSLFAERMPLWFKRIFNGCESRHSWWNLLVQLVPMKRRS